MSHSLNPLKGGYVGDYIGVTKGDTRSLDYSSHSSFVSRDHKRQVPAVSFQGFDLEDLDSDPG